MRVQGRLASLRNLGAHDHPCVAFGDAAEFLTGAVRFLEDGINGGLRAWYVGKGSFDAIAESLASTGLARHIGTKSLMIDSVDSAYRADVPFDPFVQVSAYASATKDALGAGFLGLRVAADATSLITDEIPVDTFVRYEHLVDRFMARAPFSAVCGYNIDTLGANALVDIAAVHPATTVEGVPFHLFALDGERFALVGDIELSSLGLFERTLAHLAPRDRESIVRIDVGSVDFIDHRALLALSAHAERHEIVFVLENESDVVRKMMKILRCPRIKVWGER